MMPVETYLLLISSIFITLCIADDAAASQNVFRKDYVFSPETQTFYKLHTSKMKFSEAVNRCKLEGAALFVPETKLERDVVVNLMVDKYRSIPKDANENLLYPRCFMGVHDSFTEGEFITLDGRSIDTIFVEWEENEPNNYNNEDCLQMSRTGKVNDHQCDQPSHFICEKSQASVEWNSMCGLPDFNYLYNKDLGKCYKLHLQPKDWKDAYTTCGAEQSYLAVINNQAEADYLVKIVSEADKTGIRAPHYYANAAYLGFHNQFLSGFVTVTGQPLSELDYTRWAPGQPDNAGDERCGSMFFDGSLNDLTCGLSAIFICEHDVEGHSTSLEDKTNPVNNVNVPFFRKDYEFNPISQSFYKLHKEKRTWAEAKAKCELESARLFIPTTKLDWDTGNTFIDTKIQTNEWIWVGIHNLLSDSEFITIEGIPLENVYHEWAPNEPSRHDDEHCLVIWNDVDKLNDANCLDRRMFLCEKPKATIDWNILCGVPDGKYLYDRDQGKCYKLHLSPHNWMDAYQICLSEQSYLTIINSKSEADHIVRLIAEAPKENIRNYFKGLLHLGFHNRLGEGFTTIQGVKLGDSGYSMWGAGQPDNAGGDEKCGSMFFNGVYNDIQCSAVCIFMCEHDIELNSSALDERLSNNLTSTF